MLSLSVSKGVVIFSVLPERKNKDCKKKQAKNYNKTKSRLLKNKLLSRDYNIKA